MSDSVPEPGEDLVDWAYETGRIPKSKVEQWRSAITASADAADVLRILTPGLRPGVAASVVPRSQPLNLTTATAPVSGSAAMGRNPLVAAARERDPRAAAAADAKGPAPTLFHTGDLPPFTASGIDPKALLNVPWPARHPIAAAPDHAAAYGLVQRYSEPEAADDAAATYGAHAANKDYQQRVQQWLSNGRTEDEIYSALFPPGSPLTARPDPGITNLAVRHG